jgi:nucleotide-binding universal stress UspA family protein
MTSQSNAVVVGVDHGPDARRAVRWAAAEADRLGAGLHLVYAFFNGYRDLPPTDAEYQRLRSRALLLLEETREALGETSTGPVTTEAVDVAAGAALVALSTHARLTVVGSRGHPVGYDLLIGSVAMHLAHHAHSPVAVVREQADATSRRIVVGWDGSPGSEAALGWAFEAAARRAAPLAVLHGWAEHGHGLPEIGVHIHQHERKLVEAVAPWREKYPDIEVAPEAIGVHPAEMLTAASAYAALVVVGARGHGVLPGVRLGSVSQAALRHASCPVVIAR